MKRSASVVRGVVAVLALYVGVLVVDGPHDGAEIFPFFNWSLFSRVPAEERVSWSVRLVEVDGEALADPVYFDEAGDLISTSASPDAHQLMQRLGRAVEAGDVAAVEDARALLEGRFLRELEAARYELVRRRYDVLDRITCDCFLEEVVVSEHVL